MEGWRHTDFAWDPYRLVAVEDSSAAALHENARQLGTQPESLVPPVLPGPALPSAAASRASKAMCKVEGCQRLLRDEKPYYQRFLVCEEHMRCLSLDINGQFSRFCQQCGKFEPVEAFDNNKRSCRARLQEHNKRRRKMGVSSRSLRKHRRNAAAANKAAKAAAAAAMGAAPVEQQADADDADADADADGADTDPPAQPAVVPTSSSNAAQPPSCGSSSDPTQQQLGGEGSAGGGTAAAAVAAGVRQGSQTPPPAAAAAGACGEAASGGCSLVGQLAQRSTVPGDAAAAAAAAAAAVAAETEAEAGALLLTPAAGGCWPADPPACWSGGLLSHLQPVQEQQHLQLLASPRAGHQQEQQQLGWLKAEPAAMQPAAVAASPTISDIFQGDSIIDDVAGLADTEVVQPAAMLLPAPLLYESSLLFRPADVTAKHSQAEQPPPAAVASGATADAGSSRQAGRFGSTHGSNAHLQSASGQVQVRPEQHRQHGSSCSINSAQVDGSTQRGTCIARSAAAAAVPGAAASAAAAAAGMFSEEDRRLLDQLLAESAEHIGTALQPGLVTAPPAAAQAVNGKRYRSLQGDQGSVPVLPSAACAEHAKPLPSIPLDAVAVPPIEQRDDSAEDHRLCIGGANSSSDSGGSSKRQKQRSSAPSSRSHRHGAREAEAAQLAQQQLQYQQLQELQQQLQHSLLAGPYTQPQQQQQQQQFQSQPMLCGVAGMATGVPPAASAAAAAAAAAVAAINPDAPRELSFDQQLENLMQRTGLAQQQQQVQQVQPLAAAFAAAAGSSAGVAGMQDALSLAAQGCGAQGVAAYGASQLQLQEQQQQQQLLMAQYMSLCSTPSTYQGPWAGGYGMAGMQPAAGWGGSAAAAAAAPVAPMQWQAPSAGQLQHQQHQQQQAQQQQTWMQQALAVAQGGAANASYQPVDSSMRMSIKLHGAQPGQLQPEMHQRLNSLLGGSGSSTAAAPGAQVECGYMRPGCVHLVLQLRSPADVQGAVEALAAAGQGVDPAQWRWALMNSSPSSSLDSSAADQQQELSITVQFGSHSVLVVREGEPDPAGAVFLQGLLQQQQGVGPSVLGGSSGLNGQQQPPQLQALLPCCISSRSAAANGRCQLLVIGTNLGAAPDGSVPAPVPLVRCQGMFLAAAAVPATPMQATIALQLLEHARQGTPPSSSSTLAAAASADAAPAAASCAAVVVEGLQPYGLVHVEFMQGLLLSEAQPLLVVDDDAVAAEVQALQRAVLAGGDQKKEAQSILVDFGRLLDFRAAAKRHAGSTLQDDAAAAFSGGPEGAPRSQPGRNSISAPLPATLMEEAADAADAPRSCGNLASPQQPAGGLLAASTSSHAAAGWLSGPSPAGGHAVEQRAGPSRTPSRDSSSSSLRGSLRSLFGGSRAARADDASGSSSGPGRRSFALERRPAQQQLAEDGSEGAAEREAPVSCFPTRRLRSSFSFSRRHSLSLETPAQQLGPSASREGSVHDGARSEATHAWLADQELVPAGAGAAHHHALQEQQSGSSARGQHGDHEQRARRRSFGDVLLCRSSSRRALTRSLGCGARAEGQQLLLPDASVSAHGPSVCCSSDLGARGHSEQPAQGGSISDHADEADEVASAAGDSVSSFQTPSNAASTPPSLQEHPLLTASYKGLMMDVGVRLLCYFLDRGWAASSRMVLSTLLRHAAPVASFRAVVSAVAACNGEQLGLLHRAVRSGEVGAITEVMGWAVQHRMPLAWDGKGPNGLTPLHLLALTGCKSMLPSLSALQPGAALQPSLAAMVLQTSPGLCSLWFNTYDDAGMTPAWYASKAGADNINQLASGCLLLRGNMPSTSSATSPGAGRASTVQPGPPAPTEDTHSGSLRVTAARPAWQPLGDDSAHRAAAVELADDVAGPAPLLQTASDEPVVPSPATHAASQRTAAAAVSAPGQQGVEVCGVLPGISTGPEQQQRQDQDRLAALVLPVASSGSTQGSTGTSQAPAESAAAVSAASPFGLASGNGSSSSSTRTAAADTPSLQAKQVTADQPSAAVVALAGLMFACQQAVQAHPRSWRRLQKALLGMRVLWVFLLLQAVMHGSVGLMLFALAAGTTTTLLLRLLPVITQPLLSPGLTDAVELQVQLRVLVRHVCTPLPQPHSAWLLTFDRPCLEKQYQKLLAEAREPVDATISATIKGLISIQPLLRNLCGHRTALRLLAAPCPQWNMPTMHLLTAAAAASLPLVVSLTKPGSAHSMRDSVLFVTQASLLMFLRKPLLAAATAAAAGGAAAVAGAGGGIVASGQLFHGCIAALLLLLFRQRLCWAAWQATADAVLGLVLLSWDLYAASPLPAWQTCAWSLLHVLLPVLVLPFLYLREKVDRQIALSSILEQKQLKVKEC